MIGFRHFLLIILNLASILVVTNCLQMFQPSQQQQSMGLPAQALMAPIITRQDNEDGDSYVVLTDEELLQNADMLRHLSLATKEEVEEIVEGNPAIQQALLSKIKKVLKLREEANHLNNALNHQHKQQPVVVDGDNKQPHQTDGENDDDDIDEFEEQMAAEKIEMVKMKLKNNAAKLFKLGNSIKKKINALRRKKAQAHAMIPKFHVNVSTSREKSSNIPIEN